MHSTVCQYHTIMFFLDSKSLLAELAQLVELAILAQLVQMAQLDKLFFNC